ncbi:hypothetical protein [Aureimonas fodinaquatilis]|uniref:hypothetical protein n=1 Tax=Aureimonas fodinaquatilis TaxID=2565783 RepID=UPI00165D75C3|nr:hypothetical protein [Aureimonas fodinaquatilis]
MNIIGRYLVFLSEEFTQKPIKRFQFLTDQLVFFDGRGNPAKQLRIVALAFNCRICHLTFRHTGEDAPAHSVTKFTDFITRNADDSGPYIDPAVQLQQY